MSTRTRIVNSIYNNPGSVVNVNVDQVMRYSEAIKPDGTKLYDIIAHKTADNVVQIMCLTFVPGAEGVRWINVPYVDYSKTSADPGHVRNRCEWAKHKPYQYIANW